MPLSNQRLIVRSWLIIGAIFAAEVAGLALGSRAAMPPGAGHKNYLVRSIQPPDWWKTTRLHHLELLLTGHHLRHIRMRVAPSLFHLSDIHASQNGHYLFLTLAWKGTAPNAARLRLAGAGYSQNLLFRFRSGPAPHPAGFSPADVVYLIMVDRFAEGPMQSRNYPASTVNRRLARAYHGGNFNGIRRHLLYLKKLGITALWLTPVYQNDPASAQDYHGYSAVNEYQVEAHFGTLHSLRQLVRDAHRLGLKVIQDQIANHVGPHDRWVMDPPSPDWFHGHGDPRPASFHYSLLIDPHAAVSLRHGITHGWFDGILPDLNQNNPDVARYEIQNSLWWLGMTGMDGIREDTFPMVGCKFWRQWSRALAREFPQVRVVGEDSNPHPAVNAYFNGRCTDAPAPRRVRSGAHAQPHPVSMMDYPLFYALRKVFAGTGSFYSISAVLAQDRLYSHPHRLMIFLGNHDQPRFISAATQAVCRPQPAVKTFSPAAVCALARVRLEMADAFLLSMRGMPQLYYGDEIGMAGGGDPGNRHDFPGGFPGDREDAFRASGRTPSQQAIWNRLHALLRLRRRHPALQNGSLREILVRPHQYAYIRRLGNDAVLAAFNTASHQVVLRLQLGHPQRWQPRLGAPPLGFHGRVRLPADTFALWVERPAR